MVLDSWVIGLLTVVPLERLLATSDILKAHLRVVYRADEMGDSIAIPRCLLNYDILFKLPILKIWPPR